MLGSSGTRRTLLHTVSSRRRPAGLKRVEKRAALGSSGTRRTLLHTVSSRRRPAGLKRVEKQTSKPPSPTALASEAGGTARRRTAARYPHLYDKERHEAQLRRGQAGLVIRPKRAQGQLTAVIRMLEEGEGLRGRVMELSAVARAVDQAGYLVVSTGLRKCFSEEGAGSVDEKKLEKMFLPLA